MADRRRRSGTVWLLSFVLFPYGFFRLWDLFDQFTGERTETWWDIAWGVALGGGSLVAVAAFWWPRLWWPHRPLVLDPRVRVVARPVWRLRVGGFFAGVMGGGIWSVPLGLTTPEPDPTAPHLHGVVGLMSDVLIGTIATVLLMASWGAFWFRQSISPDEATSRVFLRSHRINSATATAIRIGEFTLHSGAAGQSRVGRVFVEGPDRRGKPAKAAFDPTMTKFLQARAVLQGWVQRRPELVAGDEFARAFLAPGEVEAIVWPDVPPPVEVEQVPASQSHVRQRRGWSSTR